MHPAYNKTYNFDRETQLGDFANRIYDKELSLDEANKDQNDFLEEIDELDNRTDPLIGKKSSKKNIESMKKVVENARELYDTRNYIIEVFWNSEAKKLKQTKKIQGSDFNWMFKEKGSKKQLEELSSDIENINKTVPNVNDLKNIPDALIRFISKILVGNIDSLQRA